MPIPCAIKVVDATGATIHERTFDLKGTEYLSLLVEDMKTTYPSMVRLIIDLAL